MKQGKGIRTFLFGALRTGVPTPQSHRIRQEAQGPGFVLCRTATLNTGSQHAVCLDIVLNIPSLPTLPFDLTCTESRCAKTKEDHPLVIHHVATGMNVREEMIMRFIM